MLVWYQNQFDALMIIYMLQYYWDAHQMIIIVIRLKILVKRDH